MRILILLALAAFLHAAPPNKAATGFPPKPPLVNPSPTTGLPLLRLDKHPTQKLESNGLGKVSTDEGTRQN